MKIRNLHPWDVSPQEAVKIQTRLSPSLTLKRRFSQIHYVAGTDVSCSKKSDKVWACVVVLDYPELVLVEEKWVRGETTFPYVPGLLSFREIPVLLEALKGIKRKPDIILCDGQGTAHPRGLGLASHLGLSVDTATVGCAKSRLVGEFSSIDKNKGSFTPLRYKGRVVGAAARTRTGVSPLFISPGNHITLAESLEIVFRCCPVYRIPEPIRMAHMRANQLRRKEDMGS